MQSTSDHETSYICSPWVKETPFWFKCQEVKGHDHWVLVVGDWKKSSDHNWLWTPPVIMKLHTLATLPDTWFCPLLGLACAPIVETRFLELAMSLLDFTPWIPLGTFSILLKDILYCFGGQEGLMICMNCYYKERVTILLKNKNMWVIPTSNRITINTWRAKVKCMKQ